VSHTRPSNSVMTENSPAPNRHIARGIALSVVLVPLVIIAFAVAALAILYAMTSWGPDSLKSWISLNFIYGYGGGGFTAERFFIFMGGAMIGIFGLAAIRWGFTDKWDTD